MPEILTTGHTILCPHGGPGTSIPLDPTFQLGNNIGLLEGDSGSIACPFLLFPCIGYNLASMGLNASTVRSRRVMLISDFNQTFTGLPLTILPAGTGIIDDSVPAAIPAGQPVPPLSAELADATAPQVTAVPTTLSFNTVTLQPALLVVTFTLFSPFPMNWQLTLIKGTPAPGNVDLTGGIPGATVLPSGGTWNQPTLVVTLTLTAVFMSALGIGVHQFFMTGISKRGLSGFNHPPVTLTVS